jgi:hypothetical protein
MENGTVQPCLEELDGQALLSAIGDATLRSSVLKFDLEGAVYLSPWAEAAPGDAQWSLYAPDGNIIFHLTNGSFSVERSDRLSGDPS